MIEGVLLTLAAAASACFTWAFLKYALARQVMDIPNERSAHTSVTPRGGGMAIVVTYLCLLFILQFTGVVESSLFAALAGSGLIVAIIGFFDDHRPIPAISRLLTHFVAAAWALIWLSSSLESVFANTMVPVVIIYVVAVLYAVWLTNLYNFMDGIDGIASIEAVTVGLGGAVLYWLVLPGGYWLVPALLAACAAGFLVWNFPPARIFLGDSGSGFLGITIAVISLQALSFERDLFCAWLILIGVFVVDATTTLGRRALNGETLFQAHSCHAYQNAARSLGSHGTVSLAIGAINIFWLLPVSTMVSLDVLSAATGILITYAPLFLLCLLYSGGVRRAG